MNDFIKRYEEAELLAAKTKLAARIYTLAYIAYVRKYMSFLSPLERLAGALIGNRQPKFSSLRMELTLRGVGTKQFEYIDPRKGE